jgi:hypothetical protein
MVEEEHGRGSPTPSPGCSSSTRAALASRRSSAKRCSRRARPWAPSLPSPRCSPGSGRTLRAPATRRSLRAAPGCLLVHSPSLRRRAGDYPGQADRGARLAAARHLLSTTRLETKTIATRSASGSPPWGWTRTGPFAAWRRYYARRVRRPSGRVAGRQVRGVLRVVRGVAAGHAQRGRHGPALVRALCTRVEGPTIASIEMPHRRSDGHRPVEPAALLRSVIGASRRTRARRHDTVARPRRWSRDARHSHCRCRPRSVELPRIRRPSSRSPHRSWRSVTPSLSPSSARPLAGGESWWRPALIQFLSHASTAAMFCGVRSVCRSSSTRGEGTIGGLFSPAPSTSARRSRAISWSVAMP